jgi:hypothetical protein
MQGYFFSFLITHLVNFALSIRLLLKLVGRILRIRTALSCILAAVVSVYAVTFAKSFILTCVYFVLLFGSLLVLLGVLKKTDFTWLKGLVRPKVL